MKQCQHKNYSSQQIFERYPFSNMEIFKFDDEQLRNEKGEFSASIVEDEKGVHLVQEYRQESRSRYITTEEEEELNLFNGLSVSILSNGSIF